MPKVPITIRMDASLLAAVRARADRENRTMTNYIETVLKRAIGPSNEATFGMVPVTTASPFAPPEPILLALDGGDEGVSPRTGER